MQVCICGVTSLGEKQLSAKCKAKFAALIKQMLSAKTERAKRQRCENKAQKSKEFRWIFYLGDMIFWSLFCYTGIWGSAFCILFKRLLDDNRNMDPVEMVRQVSHTFFYIIGCITQSKLFW